MRKKRLAFIFFSLLINSLFAVDNPHAPDVIGEFKAREQPFLKATNNAHNNSSDYLIAYDNYLKFLQLELDKAYRLVKSKVSVERQKEFKSSQLNWIKFRDAEFEFIESNWTRQEFGSSSVISRGGYRSTIVRNRVLQLLHYAKSY